MSLLKLPRVRVSNDFLCRIERRDDLYDSAVVILQNAGRQCVALYLKNALSVVTLHPR